MTTGQTETTGDRVKSIVQKARIHTVCQEASCPNLGHCWSQGSATFMIMGDTCTRRCGFCDVATGRPRPLDPDEPRRLAESVAEMGLNHAVITSVDRDELADCGSGHFAACIQAVRELNPGIILEVLIPDFKARPANLAKIEAAGPDILNHNVETVPSLFRRICPQSSYERSLQVLEYFSRVGFLTKSGIILGLGEQIDEVRQVIADLYRVGVRMLTIGQYLQPTPAHAPLEQYVPLSVFQALKQHALDMGYQQVESGPLVRSSYHAGNSFHELRARFQSPETD